MVGRRLAYGGTEGVDGWTEGYTYGWTEGGGRLDGRQWTVGRKDGRKVDGGRWAVDSGQRKMGNALLPRSSISTAAAWICHRHGESRQQSARGYTSLAEKIGSAVGSVPVSG